jgi:peptidoglycan/LPS O-acetylase OafA/YrhL
MNQTAIKTRSPVSVSLLDGLRSLVQPPASNVGALDVLRTLAILLVFSTHFGAEFNVSSRLSAFPLFYWGWSGVDLFFVLSGLLIGTQLWRELLTTGGIGIRRFLLRRGLRIWPLYFSFVAFAIGQHFLTGGSVSGIWADALCVSNYFRGRISGGWSLSTEEQFYLLAPLSICFLSWKMRPSRLWILPFSGLLALIAFRALTILHSPLDVHDLRDKLYFPIHTHADGLAVGLLIAWFAVFSPAAVLEPRRRLIASLAMFAAGAGLYTANRLIFNFTALGLLYGAATLWAMQKSAQPVLNWRVFYLISRLSYGVYLNHLIVMVVLRSSELGAWRDRAGAIGFWACYVISFVVCVAVAAVTFLLIESPFLQLRSRWLKSKAAPTPSLQTTTF